MADDDPDDDNCDAPDAQYAELRRYVPAHPRAAARTPGKPAGHDSRVSVVDWLSAIGDAVRRRLRGA